MSTDLIRYDLLVQEALKSVVRNVLADAARDGLPGEHHFCITFRTRAPGVKLSPRVSEKHPEELTIILQYQFWDLIVTEQSFEVGLSFGNVPERLVVPFDAVTGFWDPSVQFGLKFEIQDAGPETGANDAEPTVEPVTELVKAVPKPKEVEPARPEPAQKPKAQKPAAAKGATPAAAEKPEDPPSGGGSDKVVSIDAFRKKT